jgi:hypothetical protein
MKVAVVIQPIWLDVGRVPRCGEVMRSAQAELEALLTHLVIEIRNAGCGAA